MRVARRIGKVIVVILLLSISNYICVCDYIYVSITWSDPHFFVTGNEQVRPCLYIDIDTALNMETDSHSYRYSYRYVDIAFGIGIGASMDGLSCFTMERNRIHIYIPNHINFTFICID